MWLTGVDYFSTLGYQPGIALIATVSEIVPVGVGIDSACGAASHATEAPRKVRFSRERDIAEVTLNHRRLRGRVSVDF